MGPDFESRLPEVQVGSDVPAGRAWKPPSSSAAARVSGIESLTG